MENNTEKTVHVEINFDKPCNDVLNDPLRFGYLDLWDPGTSHSYALQFRKEMQDSLKVQGQCKFKGVVSVDLTQIDQEKKSKFLDDLPDFVANFNASNQSCGHIARFTESV
jgi:hypothetical protein